MISLTKKSKLPTAEVIKRAVKFFGPGGFGLEVTDQGSCCVEFEGAGGGVKVSASEAEKGTQVDIESREWEKQSKDFLASIK
jgi:hypothetical protein